MPLTLTLALAALAVGAVAARPRSRGSGGVAGACAIAVAAAGPGIGAALGAGRAVLPMLGLVAGALVLAERARRSGLAERAADALAWLARGRGGALYALTCGLAAALTLAVSLDGAVVVMAPVLLALRRRGAAPGPLLVGVVAVSNAVSPAVPQGNPTNLLLMDRLGLAPGAYTLRMLGPAALAALLAAAAPALAARRTLRASRPARAARPGRPAPGPERRAAAALAGAAAAAGLAGVLGASPWWPIALVAAAGAAWERLAGGDAPAPGLPWLLAVQLVSLLVVIGPALEALGLGPGTLGGRSLGACLAVAGVTGAAAALANNLPAAAAAAGLVAGTPAGLSAVLGLGVGALATPHGSVATLLATGAAGPGAGLGARRHLCVLAPAAAAATAAAAAAAWLGLGA